jgi:hypothetical protein
MQLLAKALEGLCIGIAVFVLQAKWQKADARSLAERENEDQRQEYFAKGVIEQTRNMLARFISGACARISAATGPACPRRGHGWCR